MESPNISPTHRPAGQSFGCHRSDRVKRTGSAQCVIAKPSKPEISKMTLEYIMQDRMTQTVTTPSVTAPRKRRQRLQFALGFAAACCLFPLASAQVSESISSTQGTLSDTQIQSVTTTVDGLIAIMTDSTAGESKEAARDLLSTRSKTSTMRSLRVPYGTAWAAKLGAIIDDAEAKIQARISALHILGSIATDAVTPVLESALTSEQASVRYAAALAYQRSFEGLANGNEAFAAPVVATREMVRRLSQAMIAEKSPYVLNAELSAIVAAPDLAWGLQNICEALKTQMKMRASDKSPARMIFVYENGIQLAFNHYVTLLTAAAQTQAQEKLLIEVAYMAMKISVLDAEKDLVNEKNAQSYIDLIKSAENVLDVVCDLDNEPNINQRQRSLVSTTFADTDYAASARALKNFWLKPVGPIYGPRNHFGFPAGSFEKLFD